MLRDFVCHIEEFGFEPNGIESFENVEKGSDHTIVVF